MIPRPIKATAYPDTEFTQKGRIISIVPQTSSPTLYNLYGFQGYNAVFIGEDGQIIVADVNSFRVTDPGYLKRNRRKSPKEDTDSINVS